MKVILLEKISRLGKTGDVVNVRPGFARNFLIPQHKALRASNENLKEFEARRAEIEAKNAEAKAAAEVTSKALDGVSVTLSRASSDEGKLFGSITVRDIAEALEVQGFTIEKSQIQIPANIKHTGTYTADIQFHAEVVVPVAVNVVRNEDAA